MVKQMDIFEAIQMSYHFNPNQGKWKVYGNNKMYCEVAVLIPNRTLSIEEVEHYSKGIWQFGRNHNGKSYTHEEAIQLLEKKQQKQEPCHMIITRSAGTNNYFAPENVIAYL